MATSFGQSSFARLALATERNTVKLPDTMPLELAGPLGCGLQTGAGAIMNSLHVNAGESVAVFGTGSVGLAAVMAPPPPRNSSSERTGVTVMTTADREEIRDLIDNWILWRDAGD
jgi:Zn-dependent alcohol dehydrogenase